MAKLTILAGVLVLMVVCSGQAAALFPPRCFCVSQNAHATRPNDCIGAHIPPILSLPMLRTQIGSISQGHGIGCLGFGGDDGGISIYIKRIISRILEEESDSFDTSSGRIGKHHRHLHHSTKSFGSKSLLNLIRILCQINKQERVVSLCKRQLEEKPQSQITEKSHEVISS